MYYWLYMSLLTCDGPISPYFSKDRSRGQRTRRWTVVGDEDDGINEQSRTEMLTEVVTKTPPSAEDERRC